MKKNITYKLRCTCPFCMKVRMVTLPQGQLPREMCCARRMEILLDTRVADGDGTEESEAF
jgi:hypothetical protein